MKWVQPVWLHPSHERKSLSWRGKYVPVVSGPVRTGARGPIVRRGCGRGRLRGLILTAGQQVPDGNGPESVPMSAGQSSPPAAACPPTPEALCRKAHQRLDEIIAYCLSETGPPSFFEFEAALLGLLRSL